jgi:hypothetical protein
LIIHRVSAHRPSFVCRACLPSLARTMSIEHPLPTSASHSSSSGCGCCVPHAGGRPCYHDCYSGPTTSFLTSCPRALPPAFDAKVRQPTRHVDRPLVRWLACTTHSPSSGSTARLYNLFVVLRFDGPKGMHAGNKSHLGSGPKTRVWGDGKEHSCPVLFPSSIVQDRERLFLFMEPLRSLPFQLNTIKSGTE